MWFRKTLDWQDYEKYNALKDVDIISARKKVRIGVVDDKPFQVLENLRSNGYEISFLGKTNHVPSFDDYNIIVCDILEVNEDENKDEQGAALIGEIKRVFPEKQVIAFSSITGNTRLWRLAKERSDDHLSKSSHLDVWFNVLDEAIMRCLDPKILWDITENKLKEAGATRMEICKVEDAFIRALKKGDPSPLKRLSGQKRISPIIKTGAFAVANSGFWALIALVL